MKKILLFILLVSIAGIIEVRGQSEEYEKAEKRVEVTIPNDNHIRLFDFAGEWKLSYIQNTEYEPSYGKGFVKNEIIYGGRFLKMVNNYNLSGFEYEEIRILGYNNIEEKYFLYRMDNLNANPDYIFGRWDEESQKIIFEGEMYNLSEISAVSTRIELFLERKNKYLFEIYQDYGDGFKNVFKEMCILVKAPESEEN